jgi:mRNA interferase MazF
MENDETKKSTPTGAKKPAKDIKERLINEWKLIKIPLSHKWIDEEKSQTARKILKGGIYFCQFGENVGNEQNEERPVLVVSNDLINQTSGNVLVIPLTKNIKTKVHKKTGKTVPAFNSHYFLMTQKYGFLTYNSAVKTEETASVSKIRLANLLGLLDPEDLNKITLRLKWSLGL